MWKNLLPACFSHLHHWFCGSLESDATALFCASFFHEGGNLDILSHLINDAQRLILFTCVYDFYRPLKVRPCKIRSAELLVLLIKRGAFIMTRTHAEYLICFGICHFVHHKNILLNFFALSPKDNQAFFSSSGLFLLPLTQDKDEMGAWLTKWTNEKCYTVSEHNRGVCIERQHKTV